MSRSRNGRYYEDSDDMVQRIRRAREEFEKKTKAFQGPDWPYYEKRIIVGQKKKEDMDTSIFQDDSTAASAGTEVGSSPSSLSADIAPEGNPANTAVQASSFWTTERETPETSEVADAKDQAATLAGPPNEGASS
jgi:hypothetical protein